MIATVESVLRDTLALKDASLVIYRTSVLVELKTDLLMPKLERFEEAGFKSWQVGSADGHHCHVDLERVDQVWFDAEPVPCQGGRLNYTVWFLSQQDCGNPHRPNGLFSVVLNGPYDAQGNPLLELIHAVYRLHDRYGHLVVVGCSAGFTSFRPQLA